ncbi:MAG: RNA polymerase subunit sigma [Planctomycetaceae bacterium]
MSGPIVRTGTTPKFWENYDRVFGGAKGKSTKAARTPAKAPAKAASKPAPAKKAPVKKAKAKKA